jgi:Recombinase
VKDPEGSAQLQIKPEEAQIVRRIFEMYSRGLSLKRIAWQLNAESVISRQPQKESVSGARLPCEQSSRMNDIQENLFGTRSGKFAF